MRKFFVEAKKPSVNLKDDPAPAYQLRRYAWSAKLPLSLLTDFQELAVYDCRVRPANGDKASAARTLYVLYEQLRGTLGRDRLGCSARRPSSRARSTSYAESTKGKKGTAEVDSGLPFRDRDLARRAGPQHRPAQPVRSRSAS